VGILDEEFFMYFEETDWCYRIARAGGEVWYVPAGEVVHHGGGSFGHYDERRLVFYFSSLFRFFEKHYPPVTGIAARCVVVARAFMRVPLWLAVALARPAARARALSAARGYARVLGVACGAGPA
jgi:GT2 family glycosyltransferase